MYAPFLQIGEYENEVLVYYFEDDPPIIKWKQEMNYLYRGLDPFQNRGSHNYFLRLLKKRIYFDQR